MPLQFVKPAHRPAIQQRIAEVTHGINAMAQAIAPAAQCAGEDISRSLRKVRERRTP